MVLTLQKKGQDKPLSQQLFLDPLYGFVASHTVIKAVVSEQ
jgi:hypothetical protein